MTRPPARLGFGGATLPSRFPALTRRPPLRRNSMTGRCSPPPEAPRDRPRRTRTGVAQGPAPQGGHVAVQEVECRVRRFDQATGDRLERHAVQTVPAGWSSKPVRTEVSIPAVATASRRRGPWCRPITRQRGGEAHLRLCYRSDRNSAPPHLRRARLSTDPLPPFLLETARPFSRARRLEATWPWPC